MMHSCRGQSHVYVSLHFSKQVKQWPHLIQILTQIKHLIKLYRCNSIDNTEKPQYITVGIKASNTEPFCKETTVYLGTTGTDLCPVAAMLDYIMQWGNHPGPTFQFQDYHPLTRPRLVTELREALNGDEKDSHKYAGHSYRIGAATTASLCGIQDSTIKMLGRWQSSAYTL